MTDLTTRLGKKTVVGVVLRSENPFDQIPG
jgi:hypothetical protein